MNIYEEIQLSAEWEQLRTVSLAAADSSLPSLPFLFGSRKQPIKVLRVHRLLLLLLPPLIEFNTFSHLFLAVFPLRSRAEPKVNQYGVDFFFIEPPATVLCFGLSGKGCTSEKKHWDLKI